MATHRNAHEQPADAIAMLKADHHRVSNLFQAYEATTDFQAKRALAAAACTELDIHTQLEEQVFYPAVEAIADEAGKHLVVQSVHEHQLVKHLIQDLLAMGPYNQRLDPTFHTVVHNVEHHVDAEEQTMFPEAAQLLGDRLQALSAEMQELKKDMTDS